MREADIEKKLREAVRKAGGRAYKWVSPGNSGVPDRVVFLPGGRIIFVELKRAGGRSTKLQQVQQDRLRTLGADVREVVGMKGLEEFMQEFGI